MAEPTVQPAQPSKALKDHLAASEARRERRIRERRQDGSGMVGQSVRGGLKTAWEHSPFNPKAQLRNIGRLFDVLSVADEATTSIQGGPWEEKTGIGPRAWGYDLAGNILGGLGSVAVNPVTMAASKQWGPGKMLGKYDPFDPGALAATEQGIRGTRQLVPRAFDAFTEGLPGTEDSGAAERLQASYRDILESTQGRTMPAQIMQGLTNPFLMAPELFAPGVKVGRLAKDFVTRIPPVSQQLPFAGFAGQRAPSLVPTSQMEDVIAGVRAGIKDIPSGMRDVVSGIRDIPGNIRDMPGRFREFVRNPGIYDEYAERYRDLDPPVVIEEVVPIPVQATDVAPAAARTAGLTPDEVTELGRLKGNLARDEAALDDILSDTEHMTRFGAKRGAKPRPYTVRYPGRQPGDVGYRPPLVRTAAQRADDIVDAEDAVKAAEGDVADAQQGVKDGLLEPEDLTEAKSALKDARADLRQAKKQTTAYTAKEKAYIAAADKLDVEYPKNLEASIKSVRQQIAELEARQGAAVVPDVAPATTVPVARPGQAVDTPRGPILPPGKVTTVGDMDDLPFREWTSEAKRLQGELPGIPPDLRTTKQPLKPSMATTFRTGVGLEEADPLFPGIKPEASIIPTYDPSQSIRESIWPQMGRGLKESAASALGQLARIPGVPAKFGQLVDVPVSPYGFETVPMTGPAQPITRKTIRETLPPFRYSYLGDHGTVKEQGYVGKLTGILKEKGIVMSKSARAEALSKMRRRATAITRKEVKKLGRGVTSTQLEAAVNKAFKGSLVEPKLLQRLQEEFTPEQWEELVQVVLRASEGNLRSENPVLTLLDGNTAAKGLNMLYQEGKRLEPGEAAKLHAVFGDEFLDAFGKAHSMAEYTTHDRLMRGLFNVLNLPRALRSSMDLSALLRQGAMLIFEQRKMREAFALSVRTFLIGGDDLARQVQWDMMKATDADGRLVYPQYVQTSGLFQHPMSLSSFADPTLEGEKSLMTKREEAFASTLVSYIPGLKASERSYGTFLNLLRFASYDDLMRKAHEPMPKDKNGLTVQLDQEHKDTLAQFINSATGRGPLPSGGRVSNAITTVMQMAMWSPRLLSSRGAAFYYAALPLIRQFRGKGALSPEQIGKIVDQMPGSNRLDDILKNNKELDDIIKTWQPGVEKIRFGNPYGVGKLGIDDILDNGKSMRQMLDELPNDDAMKILVKLDLAAEDNPAARRILKQLTMWSAGKLGQFMGLGFTFLGLAKLGHYMGLPIDAGLDHRSADFGKIRVGKTRIDIWAGLSQQIRLVAQSSQSVQGKGQIMSTHTGQVRPANTVDILINFMQSKEQPAAQVLFDYDLLGLTGEGPWLERAGKGTGIFGDDKILGEDYKKMREFITGREGSIWSSLAHPLMVSNTVAAIDEAILPYDIEGKIREINEDYTAPSITRGVAQVIGPSIMNLLGVSEQTYTTKDDIARAITGDRPAVQQGFKLGMQPTKGTPGRDYRQLERFLQDRVDDIFEFIDEQKGITRTQSFDGRLRVLKKERLEDMLKNLAASADTMSSSEVTRTYYKITENYRIRRDQMIKDEYGEEDPRRKELRKSQMSPSQLHVQSLYDRLDSAREVFEERGHPDLPHEEYERLVGGWKEEMFRRISWGDDTGGLALQSFVMNTHLVEVDDRILNKLSPNTQEGYFEAQKERQRWIEAQAEDIQDLLKLRKEMYTTD